MGDPTHDSPAEDRPAEGGDKVDGGADRRRRAATGVVARRTRLSRREVLTAALAIIDADGVEALSMRRLGKVLGRDPMRLYRYASGKDALLDGVIELVLGDLAVPAPSQVGGWEQVLRRTAHAFRTLSLAHPHVVPLLVTRPLATPLALRPLATLRPLEDLLELFIRAGFDGRAALHAYLLYIGFLHGHVLNELQERIQDPDEHDHLLRMGLARLPVRQFPHLHALAGELASYNGEQELDEGLDVILAGLRLRTTTSTADPGAPA
jgi:AcrR family transcriptional regulator